MPQLTIEVRNLIIQMIEQGMTQKHISELVGCSQGAVSNLYSKYKENGSTSSLVGRSRKEKLNRSQKLSIKRMVNSKPTISATEILRGISCQAIISKWTIYRYLRSIGIFSRIGKVSSVSSKIHRKKRVIFCKKYTSWNDTDWSKVIFSDETSIQLAPKRRTIVKRPKGARNVDRYVLKHKYSERRSVMFWGAICGDGSRYLEHVSGTINSEKYIQILKNVFPAFPSDRILQQDRAPPHVSALTKKYFSDYGVIILEPWPPCSPDLNPIENLWSLLKKKVILTCPANIPNLIEIVKEEFNGFCTDYIEKLCSSMKRRVSVVLKSNGKGSKY